MVQRPAGDQFIVRGVDQDRRPPAAQAPVAGAAVHKVRSRPRSVISAPDTAICGTSAETASSGALSAMTIREARSSTLRSRAVVGGPSGTLGRFLVDHGREDTGAPFQYGASRTPSAREAAFAAAARIEGEVAQGGEFDLSFPLLRGHLTVEQGKLRRRFSARQEMPSREARPQPLTAQPGGRPGDQAGDAGRAVAVRGPWERYRAPVISLPPRRPSRRCRTRHAVSGQWARSGNVGTAKGRTGSVRTGAGVAVDGLLGTDSRPGTVSQPEEAQDFGEMGGEGAEHELAALPAQALGGEGEEAQALDAAVVDFGEVEVDLRGIEEDGVGQRGGGPVDRVEVDLADEAQPGLLGQRDDGEYGVHRARCGHRSLDHADILVSGGWKRCITRMLDPSMIG